MTGYRRLASALTALAVGGSLAVSGVGQASAVDAPSLQFRLADQNGGAIGQAAGQVTVLVPSAELAANTARAAADAAGPAASEASRKVGTYRADAAGVATLAVPMTAELAGVAADNDGWVNFEATVGTGAAQRFVSFSRRWDGRRWAGRAGEGEVARVSAAALPAAASTAPSSARSATASGVTALAGYPHATCVWWGPVSTTTANTVVGELHAGWDTIGEFNYGRTADTDVEVGYKYGTAGWVVSDLR